MTGPGTNTYLFGTDELAVIDPGPDDEVHRAALRGRAGARARSASSWSRTRTAIMRRVPPRWPRPGGPGGWLRSGRRLRPRPASAGGWTLSPAPPRRATVTLEAVHTPGHASDHLCWLLEESRTLLTGDHVMHGSTVVIRPPDGDLGDYLSSLARVRDSDPPIVTLAPGHGRLMEHVPASSTP